MQLPQQVKLNGSVSWNDGRRLIKLKKELKLFLPGLSERSRDYSYDMELYFKEDALKERVRKAIKEKQLPILVFLRER